ncbi:hypothetical protein NLJ89_g6174 [Agrocybe chaxingu]|uniref:Uncharacterized protein n=1 Tax=Agrocybe chaxingu TaxID=84603 RepID=A0A9W8MUB3_9AGAR|nr:hypothetical protein NLJ89_g6174 [Agrocybe chaxingu]
MWPTKVLRQFELVPPNPEESDLYGAYNKLLNFYFPPDSDFSVFPRYLKAGWKEPADYVFFFEILLENKPVFVLELKAPSAIKFLSTRSGADAQIRTRLGDLADHCPLATLHGVSSIGTKLCFYTIDKATMEVTPEQLMPHPNRVTDIAPANRWDCDILEPEGETRLNAVFQGITEKCGEIATNDSN